VPVAPRLRMIDKVLNGSMNCAPSELVQQDVATQESETMCAVGLILKVAWRDCDEVKGLGALLILLSNINSNEHSKVVWIIWQFFDVGGINVLDFQVHILMNAKALG